MVGFLPRRLPMRLLVVSNRLPIVITQEQGELKFQESAGGLVSGLSAYLDSLKGSSFAKSDYVWVGWPGVTVENKLQEQVKSKVLSQFRAYPVFLTERAMEKFYYGFCNKTIWPLFHYFPTYAVYQNDFYLHYKCVNQIFCEAVIDVMQPDDVVWIHDYHLMLLPKLLRDKKPHIPIGFFLHIPFPSFELFRLLPMTWRSEILQGLLGADLIGFHTYDYTQYFLRCVLRILGYEHNMGNILLPDRLVKVDTFPMGIDFQKFQAEAATSGSQKDESWKALENFKIVLSIDRLDYTKGILKRLQGYELFLEKNPQWQKKVVLVLVVVPSRVAVEHYQQIKKQIDELVGKINGRFGTIGWTPILYQYKFMPFDALVSLYAASDVALITPLRDGMNLIAKEYIASRTKKTGVLILSEMAGAAKELAEAIVINPNSIEEVAAALAASLEMPEEEQIERNRIMQDRLKSYDVVRWADDFLSQLLSIKAAQKSLPAKLLAPPAKERLLRDFSQARQRLIFLDYDGTLVPFADDPQAVQPSEELLAILRNLSQQPANQVVLISGRDRNTMQRWFGSINAGLVAEHGVWTQEKNQDWQLIKPLNNNWKPTIIPLLATYADRLPRAFVEEKEFSVVWHYRRADPELASTRAKELVDDLVNFTANIDVQVLQGSKVVEVRCGGVNKGNAAARFLAEHKFGFILAVGDDWTDEDLFKILPDTAYSIRVGIRQSYARFNLRSYVDVVELLKELAAE
jgi:trehalose 6-phosphate synthase/phosphatase